MFRLLKTYACVFGTRRIITWYGRKILKCNLTCRIVSVRSCIIKKAVGIQYLSSFIHVCVCRIVVLANIVRHSGKTVAKEETEEEEE